MKAKMIEEVELEDGSKVEYPFCNCGCGPMTAVFMHGVWKRVISRVIKS